MDFHDRPDLDHAALVPNPPLKRTILFSTATVTLVLALLFLLAPVQFVAANGGYPVVAAGLNNPRGLYFDGDGNLYIAEAGYGGDGSDNRCFAGPEGTVCYGDTGGVSMVALDGTQTRIISNMPSLANPISRTGGVGPHDVWFNEAGQGLVVTGLGADPAIRASDGPLGEDGMGFGRLVQVNSDNSWTLRADIAAHEAMSDVIPPPDSNPWRLIQGPMGLLVTDAGANTLVSIDMTDNSVDTMAVFANRMMEFPPNSGSIIPMNSVPTGLAVGPNDGYLVGELTGFPFPQGGARVYWVSSDGMTQTLYAEGFTNIVDIVYNVDNGYLYVLEIDSNGLAAEGGTGRVIEVRPGGIRQVIADVGLVMPTGMAMGPDGMLYVSNFGVFATGAPEGLPPGGMVVQIDPANPTAITVSDFGSQRAPRALLALAGFALAMGALMVLRRR